MELNPKSPHVDFRADATLLVSGGGGDLWDPRSLALSFASVLQNARGNKQ